MLKHAPKERLRLKRETIKVVSKLSRDQLRRAAAGLADDGCTDSSSTMDAQAGLQVAR